MRGKLIVIEGTDCSGKETQSKKLIEKLNENNIKCEYFSFPCYESATGKIIGGPYLGKKDICDSYFDETAPLVSPYVSSLYYAADRKYNIDKITDLLDKGINVILDRYFYSNMAHQGGKILNKEERLKMYKWIEKLEIELLELPIPDIKIFLYVPLEYSNELKKNRKSLDQNELNPKHLKAASDSYLEISDIYKFKKIDCITNNKMRTIDDINNELYKYVIDKIA